MNKLYIKDFDGLANEMYGNILEGKYDATFIGNYYDSSTLIKSLLKLDDVTPYQILLEPDEWDGYDREFLITLDSDLNIWCEKAYREENGYFTFDADCMYLADDCDLEIIDHIEANEIYEVSYDTCEDDQCGECCDCCICHDDCDNEEYDLDNEIVADLEDCEITESMNEYHNVSRNKDGKVTGFTKSWSTERNGMTEYSSFSYMGNDENVVRRLAEDFGIKIN